MYRVVLEFDADNTMMQRKVRLNCDGPLICDNCGNMQKHKYDNDIILCKELESITNAYKNGKCEAKT